VKETPASKKKRVLRILNTLRHHYPGVRCALEFSNPMELLVATVLSAQCTDKRVNLVTPSLFRKYRDASDYAAADPSELEEAIRSTGFYKNKAKHIRAAAGEIVRRHGGKVPRRLEDLVALPGVGRKTANVILGNAFAVPGIAVDTHMIRVNRRLGLTDEQDPVKIERDLMALVPRRDWTRYSHWIIHHGRVCCSARRPRCPICPVREYCPSRDRV